MRADESKKEADLLKEEMRSRRFSAPKRPGSSYTIYIQDNFEEVKKANPKKDATEIFKLIAEKWNNSTDKIKQKYKAMLDKKKEVFQTQAEEFETQGYFKNGEGGKKRRSVSVSNSASKSTKKAKQSVRGKSKA